MKHYCGIFGICSSTHNVLRLTYLGLYALQHRGQESAGIAYYHNGNEIRDIKGMGLVSEVFADDLILSTDKYSRMAIGHVRYSTTGASSLQNAQPLVVQYKNGPLALAHNGNIINAATLRSQLEQRGTIFQTQSDTEVIIHLIAQSKADNLIDSIKDALSKIKGAYSLVIMTENKIIAIRDPHGFRPLCFGKIADDFCVSSENCAFSHVDGTFIRELEPGEILVLEPNQVNSYPLIGNDDSSVLSIHSFKKQQCMFELIYLARPDSKVFGQNVYMTRKKMGQALARIAPVDTDIVVPIPDSGIPAALGYSEESKVPYELALLRNHYIGRTFIHPEATTRLSKIRIKLNPIRELIENKRLVVVDDSIVRGSTSREITQMLRKNGAKEIHFRISSPPVHYPCYYGIDIPTKEELIANALSETDLAQYLGADSVVHLDMDSLLEATDGTLRTPYCLACFNGSYSQLSDIPL